MYCRALLHFLDPVKFNSKDSFVEKYKNLSSFNETEVVFPKKALSSLYKQNTVFSLIELL